MVENIHIRFFQNKIDKTVTLHKYNLAHFLKC